MRFRLIIPVALLAASALLASDRPPVTATGADLADLTGRRVEVLAISGAERTSEAVIRDAIATAEDEPLDLDRLRSDRLTLLASGAFTAVTVSVVPRGEAVAVTFVVAESPTYRLHPEFLITAEDGLAVGGGVSTPNAEGLLIRGRLSVLFGAIQQTHIAIAAPRVGRRYGDFGLVYFNRQRRNTLFDFFEVANEVFVTAAPRIAPSLAAGVRLGYQRMRADAVGPTLSADRVDDVNTVGGLIALDTRDNPLLTRRGWQSELLAERTGLLGGDTRFWRITADARRWQPLGRGHGLAFFGLATWTSGDVGEEIAPWQTFRVGGASTVRGWPVGARAGADQAIATAEYRWTVRAPRALDLPWLAPLEIGAQAVAFVDAGLAWNGPADARLDRVITGHGAGLHLIAPSFGRLRLDIAWGGADPALLLLFGTGEKADGQRRRVR